MDGVDDPEIEIRLQLALARVSRHLDERERELVRRRIGRLITSARQLRSVPLANNDEPAPGFTPMLHLVGDEGRSV